MVTISFVYLRSHIELFSCLFRKYDCLLYLVILDLTHLIIYSIFFVSITNYCPQMKMNLSTTFGIFKSTPIISYSKYAPKTFQPFHGKTLGQQLYNPMITIQIYCSTFTQKTSALQSFQIRPKILCTWKVKNTDGAPLPFLMWWLIQKYGSDFFALQ